MLSPHQQTLGAKKAAELDRELMSEEGGFSIDQLMELAGLSVAQAGELRFLCLSIPIPESNAWGEDLRGYVPITKVPPPKLPTNPSTHARLPKQSIKSTRRVPALKSSSPPDLAITGATDSWQHGTSATLATNLQSTTRSPRSNRSSRPYRSNYTSCRSHSSLPPSHLHLHYSRAISFSTRSSASRSTLPSDHRLTRCCALLLLRRSLCCPSISPHRGMLRVARQRVVIRSAMTLCLSI